MTSRLIRTGLPDLSFSSIQGQSGGIKGPYSGSTQPPGSHHQTTRVAAYGKLAGTVGGGLTPCCSATAGLFLSPHTAGGFCLKELKTLWKKEENASN